MNDNKEKNEDMFLWDSESDDEDDYYISPEGNIYPIHTLHLKSFGFGHLGGDIEEILTLGGGRILNHRLIKKEEKEKDDEREGEEERAHKGGEPSAP